MTFAELYGVLTKQIEDLTDERIPFENRRKMATLAETVNGTAKQVINLADVMLRAEVAVKNGAKADSTVLNLLTGGYVLMHKDENGAVSGRTL